MEKRLYLITWYPKCSMDCESRESYVLCSTKSEARAIADKCFKGVDVARIEDYASISGGNKGYDYWADYVMEDGQIMRYEEYIKKS